MTFEIAAVLAIVVLAVVLFATEKLPVDLVALIIMAILVVTGLITAEEGISGFSNSATVTVGAMFIISAALSKTGAVNSLANIAARLFRYNFWIALFFTMIASGVISSFINNTPVVAVFIPILLGVAKDNDISPTKLLMPLSFASMFGGVCTLIGTSTNILVSSIAETYGLPAFTMFEFTELGLIFFGVGIAYMLIIGVRAIPSRRGQGLDLTETFGMGQYLTDIVLLPGAKSIGKNLIDCPLVKELDIDILEVFRDKKRLSIPPARTIMQVNDVLRVRCDVKKIKQLQERQGIILKTQLKFRDKDLVNEDLLLVEAVIAPNSSFEGKTLKQIGFRNRFQSTVLALRHRGQLLRQKIGTTPLKAGDALLIEVMKDHLELLRSNDAFVFISELGLPQYRKSKIWIALLIVTGVILTATFNVFPILVSAIIGSVLLILTGCIKLDEAYKAIEWKVIFLLAGALTMGVAMEKSGAALYLANSLVELVADYGPTAVLSVFFIITALLTSAMSNNATAVLLTPIAIATSESLGIDSRPLLIAVMFAASASFMTPVGYQTNTMIYGVGLYKYSDFLKIGTPLNLIFWFLATLLIPFFFPF